MTGCSISKNISQECNCDYVPPIIKSLLIRKTKKGQYQVKINGKGKWIAANYNEERKTIIYSA